MSPHAKLATAVASMLMLVGQRADADVVQAQCLDASVSAQSLRRDGKLAEAREMLVMCGEPQCPALVRDDCAHRRDELDRAQPTIAFTVQDRAGADVTGIRVWVDGRVLAEKLSSVPVPVDPGSHAFTFEVPGEPPVVQSLVVKEGEKRAERIALGGGRVAEPQRPEAQSTGHGGAQRTLGIAGIGLGVAGLAVGGVFGVLASSAWNKTRGECGSPQVCPNYNQAVLDRATTVNDGLVSTVGLIAGAVLLVGGGTIFFTAGSSTTVTPDVGPNAASLTLKGRF